MTHSSVLRGNSLMVVVKAMFIVAIATSWLGVHGQVNGSVAYSIYREGLIQIQITRLCEDSRGRIWVGTKDGICIYSPETHTFESRLTNSKLQTGVVNGIENDRHGKLWYLTIRGLYSEDGDSIQLPGFTKAIPPIKFCFDHKNRLWYVHFRSGKAFCLIGDRQIGLDALFPKLKQQHFSHVWFHAGSGHIVLRTNKKEFFYLDEKQQQVHPIPKDSLTVFRVSDRQEIYAFSSKGMYRIVPGGTPEFVMPLPGEDWKEIVQADMDTDGNCYFTRQNRLFQIREGKQFDYGTPFKLTTDVLVSKKGAIYVGTEEGLVVYHVPTFHYWDERDRVFDAYCMVRDKKGILWYQALGYGLYRFDSATAAFVEDSSYFHLFDRVDRGRDLRYNFYLGSTQAQDGNLLLAHGKGIMVKEGGNFRFLNDAADGGDLTVLDILEDTAHHRIFAASHALLEFDKAGNYHPLKEEAKQFNRRYFLALEVGPNGTIWAGETAQLGLVKGDSIVVVNHGGGGFPIHYDHRRLLWTGGKEGVGLWVLDPERHCSIRIAPSFLNRKMAFIEKIDESFLMVGTASGLFLLRLDEFYRSGRIFLAHYNQHNGLMGRECGQNSAFKDQNGEFLFATDNAIMRFDPAQLKKELGYPFDTTSIHVIDAQEISTGTSLEEGVENFHSFRFDQNQYKFQFSCDDGGHFVLHYILTQLGNPQKVQQVGVSANGEINLTGLTKGKYHLSVIPDLNGRKLVLAKEMSWRFEVMGSEDFWRTVMAWVILLVVLLIGIFLWARQEYLKNRITNRDKELFSLQLSRLANSADSHTYFNLLSTFEVIEDARNTMGEDELKNFYQLLRDQGKVFHDPDTFWSLRQELDHASSFVALAKLRREFQFEMQIPEEVAKILDTTQLPKALLQSLVENAYKYGVRSRAVGEASIVVRLEIQETRLLIEVIDNGLGIQNSSGLNQGSTKKGNKLILELFEVLNKYPPKNEFSFVVQERREEDQIKGVTCSIVLPIHFNYPKSKYP